jgi:anti-sigma-K factor RskA
MNYENPALIDRLAAEHVLGTLRGPARRRFERLCETNTAAARATRRWEDDLSGLDRWVRPVQPSERVWAGISARLFQNDERAQQRSRQRRRWTYAAAAGVVAIGLLIGVLVRETPVALQPVAALGADAAHPVWKIERRPDLAALTIRAVGTVEPRVGKSYELWALPRGGNPVSLGLLPADGTITRPLNDRQRGALLAADKVAVSVEPERGSPTGSPTGPVILVATIASG